MVLSSFAVCPISRMGQACTCFVFKVSERVLELRLDQSVGVAFSLVNYIDLLGLGV